MVPDTENREGVSDGQERMSQCREEQAVLQLHVFMLEEIHLLRMPSLSSEDGRASGVFFPG
jgi:hypothetical protein